MRLAEKFLESTREPGRGPNYGGSFEYGATMGHGGAVNASPPERTFHERVMEAMQERIQNR